MRSPTTTRPVATPTRVWRAACLFKSLIKLLQVLVSQTRENRFVYVIIAEDRLIPSEAKAPQPDHNVHDGAPQSGGGAHNLPGRLQICEKKRPRLTSSVGTELLEC